MAGFFSEGTLGGFLAISVKTAQNTAQKRPPKHTTTHSTTHHTHDVHHEQRLRHFQAHTSTLIVYNWLCESTLH